MIKKNYLKPETTDLGVNLDEELMVNSINAIGLDGDSLEAGESDGMGSAMSRRFSGDSDDEDF